MSSGSPPEFFLDRSLGRTTARRLRDAGYVVHLIADHYHDDAQHIADEEWIAEGCRRGWVLLTKDKKIRYRAEELDALNGHLFCLVGGNATVAKRTGARIYAPATDEAILRYPMLLPMALYGGADPLDTMRTGFLLGDASPVDEVVGPGPLTVAGIDLEVVPLYGHSPGQVGYLVDGVFFCADVVLPVAALEKYRVPYLYSATDHLAALETARAVDCRVAVAGHGPLLEDRAALHALIDANVDLLDRVAARVLAAAAEPVTADTILTDLLRHFGADPGDAPSFYLLQPTAFAFVSHLHRQGRLRHEVHDGQSLWQAA